MNQDLYTVECAKIEKDGMLFNIPCNISEKDCITIKSVTISVDGEAENIDLEKNWNKCSIWSKSGDRYKK